MSFRFTAGLLIGAAVMHFLHTEEGKAFTRKLKRDVVDMEDELAGMADGLIQKGKRFMDDLETSVDSATS